MKEQRCMVGEIAFDGFEDARVSQVDFLLDKLFSSHVKS